MLSRFNQRSTNTLIGIGISIAGNLMISIALNLQKLAHNRLEQRDHQSSSSRLKFDIDESSPLLNHRTQVEPHSSHRPSDQSSSQSQSSHAHDFRYLSSPMWWMGFTLMFAGELGNFISYGFAPASVVAPLGTVALVGNCFIAPLLLGEKFRRLDWMGIGLAIIGTITIVLSSPRHSETLTPDELSQAINQLSFILYASACLVIIIVLVFLSSTKWGDKLIGIDVGLCAISGGFTVLSTKAFSSLLNTMFLDCFNYRITWFVFAVIIVTAVLQIVFLNRALKRFDSKHVVPVQFVLFTIMAVVGSTILYGEFRDLGSAQVGNFIFACGFIFTGVYILTREKPTGAGQITTGRRGGMQPSCRSATLPPVPEESPEESTLTPELITHHHASPIENGSFSISIQGSNDQPDHAPSANKITSPSSWRSLQHYLHSPPTRTLRRQRSQPILFPRAFGTAGYYLIASSALRHPGTSHD